MSECRHLPLLYKKPSPIVSQQPFAALWIVLNAVLLLGVRFPAWSFYYLPARTRPRGWTWKQCMWASLLRWWFGLAPTFRPELTQPAKVVGPLDEVIPPAPAHLLSGVLSPEQTDVRPQARPGNWYPQRYDTKQPSHVFIFFFDGAYVLGNHKARPSYSPMIDRLSPVLGGAKWFGVGYRLASTKGNHFPAQLFDAVSAYHHVLSMGVPASKITLVGESAGGNICLALLRYLVDNPNLMPSPGSVVLSSPWVNLSPGPDLIRLNLKRMSDFATQEVIDWGAAALIPSNMTHSDPYISPALHPFVCNAPLFVASSEQECFFAVLDDFVSKMQPMPGNDVVPYKFGVGSHTTFTLGARMGFDREQDEAIEAFKQFLMSRELL